MRRICKILILLLVATTLPLRGYAAAAADLCASHHGGAMHAEHDHHDGEEHAAGKDHGSSSSMCSYCASCSVGASLATDGPRQVSALPVGTDRIPFFDARRPGHVPEHLDRPPLVP